MLGLMNLEFSEIVIVALAAVLIFGRRLPQVAGQAAGHLARARRSLESLWRETGIEREMQEVRRQVERAEWSLPRRLDPGEMARRASEEAWKQVEQAAGDTSAAAGTEPKPAGPDSAESGAPRGSD